MAVSVLAPLNHVSDANGNPYVGAQQYVYNAGTTTLRAIYTDTGLSIAADNPQTSDAAGNFPRVYTAQGTYKVRQETSGGTLINEWDNIDSGLSAGSGALPVAAGGTGATTAAAARSNLGAASTSDVNAISAQIAAFTASLASFVAAPQGRLTLTSGTPVLTSDVTAATAVYYTPYTGNICPIYDGVQFNPRTFTELTLTLNSSYILNSHYDLFVINDSGNGMTLVSGPAWSTITAGSGARGTGAGTTEISRTISGTNSGILTNANAMATARNGSSTYAVAANQGTYVGSIYIDGTAGQVTCHTSYGQSRKWGVWNQYNRRPIIMRAGDATSSWTYGSATVRQTNAAAGNTIAIFTGASQASFLAKFNQRTTAMATNGSLRVGIGVNSTTTFSGYAGELNQYNNTIYNWSPSVSGEYSAPMPLGLNNLNMLERTTAANNTTMAGGEDSCRMTVQYEA